MTMTSALVLLYGCESWTFTSALERSLDGCYTRMLRAALNISWQSFVPNEELYGTLPRISDKVAWRRLGLAGHCFRHKELLAGELVLWEPTHGRRGRGRPSATFIDTLKRDLGTDDKLELEVCMTNQEDWRARRAARLRPPWLIDWLTPCEWRWQVLCVKARRVNDDDKCFVLRHTVWMTMTSALC